MFTIDQNLYIKKPSNINRLSYLSSFKNEDDNDVDWSGYFAQFNEIAAVYKL